MIDFALDENYIEYVIAGEMAVLLCGNPRTTIDYVIPLTDNERKEK